MSCPIDLYRILHELSLNLNFYETSLGNASQWYNLAGTSFIKVNIKMTTSLNFVLSLYFSMHELL